MHYLNTARIRALNLVVCALLLTSALYVHSGFPVHKVLLRDKGTHNVAAPASNPTPHYINVSLESTIQDRQHGLLVWLGACMTCARIGWHEARA
jgi:hypothetical protein